MKKILLGIIMFISAVMLCAVTAGAESYGDYEYIIRRDGTVEITDYTGNATELEIPSEIDGKTVTVIGRSAFGECEKLTSVTIPEGVTIIEMCAFYMCPSLESVSIPESVRIIGHGAFAHCIALTSVVIPGGVEIIENGAFSDCESLSSVTLSEGVQVIETYAFLDCSSLKSIYIPDTVLGIQQQAFSKGVEFVCGRRTAGERYAKVYGLDYRYALDDETPIPDDKEIIQSGDYSYEKLNDDKISVFRYLGNDTEVFIPSKIDGKSVVRIGEKAFYDRAITSVHIPDGVIQVGESAFEKCDRLKSVRFPILTLKELSDRAFSNCHSLEKINLPSNLTFIGNYAFLECTSIREITIPPAHIGEGAFNSCSNLTKVNLSEGITVIGSAAFGKCTLLEEIILPESLTKLYAYAFEGCTSLKKIRLPKNLSASAIGIVNINDTIFDPFQNCTGLEAIEVDEENEELYSIDGVLFSREDNRLMFYPAGKTDSLYEIPEGTKIIGDLSRDGRSVFADNYYLEAITVPESVTYIGRYAFSYIENGLCVEFIGEENNIVLSDFAFSNSPRLFIKCVKGSVIHEYAESWELNFELYGGFSPDSGSVHVTGVIIIAIIPVLLIVAAVILLIVLIKKQNKTK